ncbi:MAG: tetratricopeptide repeat protein [Chloroflexota bacterium]
MASKKIKKTQNQQIKPWIWVILFAIMAGIILLVTFGGGGDDATPLPDESVPTTQPDADLSIEPAKEGELLVAVVEFDDNTPVDSFGVGAQITNPSEQIVDPVRAMVADKESIRVDIIPRTQSLQLQLTAKKLQGDYGAGIVVWGGYERSIEAASGETIASLDFFFEHGDLFSSEEPSLDKQLIALDKRNFQFTLGSGAVEQKDTQIENINAFVHGLSLLKAQLYDEAATAFAGALKPTETPLSPAFIEIVPLYEGIAYLQRAQLLESQLENQAGDRAYADVSADYHAYALGRIAYFYALLGETEQALAVYAEAASLLPELGTEDTEIAPQDKIALSTQAFIYRTWGRALEQSGDIEGAVKNYGQALPLLRDSGQRPTEAATLNQLARIYSNLGDKGKAIEFHRFALELYELDNDISGMAVTHNWIGNVRNDLGDIESALAAYQTALSLSQSSGNSATESSVLNNLGGVYERVGDLEQAAEAYVQALTLRREAGDRQGEATTMNNIASLYTKVGETDKALEFYEGTLALQRQIEDVRGEAITLNNLGRLYENQGNDTEALSNYEQSLILRRAAADRLGEATTLNNMASVNARLGNADTATENYQQSLSLLEALDAKPQIITVRGNFVQFLIEQNRLDEANVELAATIVLAEEIQHPALEILTTLQEQID